MSGNDTYTANQVVKIAGAYGKLLSELGAASIAGELGSAEDFMKTIPGLQQALERYKRVVPEALRDPILGTQDDPKSMAGLEQMVSQFAEPNRS